MESTQASFSFPDADDLKTQLNNSRAPSTSELWWGGRGCPYPYRIVTFERANTRIGDTIAVTIGDNVFLRVFLPPRFQVIVTDVKMKN